MQLTDHFSDAELGVVGCNAQIVANATQLCRVLLEPIRAQFGPLIISDGYRDTAHNLRVGGKMDSQHLYLGGNSAADFRPVEAAMQTVFDWVRLESHLLFDQIVLEYSGNVPGCIHISYDDGKLQQRRQALTGSTGDGKVYVPQTVNS